MTYHQLMLAQRLMKVRLFPTEKFPIDGKKGIDCTGPSQLWPLHYDTDLESGHMDGLPTLSHKSPSPLVRQGTFLNQCMSTCTD